MPSAVAEPRRNATRAVVLISGRSGSRGPSWTAGARAGVGFEPGSTASAHRVGLVGCYARGAGLSQKRGMKDKPFVESCSGLRLTVCLIRLGLAGLGCEDRVVWSLNNAGSDSDLGTYPVFQTRRAYRIDGVTQLVKKSVRYLLNVVRNFH